MTKSNLNEFISKRLNLFKEYLKLSDEMINCTKSQKNDELEQHTNNRQVILNDILNNDKLHLSFLKNLDYNQFSDISNKIKLAEKELVTNISLKINKLDTEYQSKAKGMESIKGYRTTYYQEKKETIRVI